MKLSRKTEYALRALIELAMHADQGNLRAQELARREKIPVKFLEQILLALKNAGILQSRRGAGGGYALSRPASRISLGEVVRSIEGPLALLECTGDVVPDSCSCTEAAFCGLRDVMMEVSRAISEVMDRVSLADICARTRELRLRQASAPGYSYRI